MGGSIRRTTASFTSARGKNRSFHPDRQPLKTCRHCGGELQDYGGYKNKMNPHEENLSEIWTDIPPVRHDNYRDRKANQLSLKIMDRIATLASEEGSTGLDPFGRSGSTYVSPPELGLHKMRVLPGMLGIFFLRIEGRRQWPKAVSVGGGK